ncbi:MAG: hypothetical protein II165_02745 [Bacteroidales bacterium]|nr:hypothetical protein [Bacteroidales bacterium]
MKNFIAKFWAILSIFLLLGSFMFGQQLQDLLMKAPFMHIDPSFSGGEVERTTVAPCTCASMCAKRTVSQSIMPTNCVTSPKGSLGWSARA